MLRVAVRLGLLLFGVWMLAACEEPAATFVVDSTVDAPSANPGDGVCESTAGGCTLRAAVQEANAVDEGRVRIEIGDGHIYTLSVVGTDDEAAMGDLDTTGDLVIHGRSVIDAAGIDRVFSVHSGHLTLELVTVTGGYALRMDGGGVWVGMPGELTLTGVEVRNNLGGGIQSAFAGVRVRYSSVVDNVGDEFGGIFVMGGPFLEVEHSTIAGNVAEATYPGHAAGVGGIAGNSNSTLRWVTVTENTGLVGGISGISDVTASVIAHQAVGPDCERPVVGKYSADSDGSCMSRRFLGDVRPTNLIVDDARLGERMTGPTGTSGYRPLPDSPLLDAIPEGEAGCGVGLGQFDQWLRLRPADGTGGGVVRCDIGAVER